MDRAEALDSQAQLPSSFDGDDDFYNEAILPKIGRKLKEEPLIPLGIGATSYALWQASKSIRSGDSLNANRMFRWRIYAQAFTLAAMVGGSLYYNRDRVLRRQWFMKQQEIKAKEKHALWIKELEFREKEDQERRAKMHKVREAQKREAEQKALQAAEPVPKVLAAVQSVEELEPSKPSAAKGRGSPKSEAGGGGVIEAVKQRLPQQSQNENEKG